MLFFDKNGQQIPSQLNGNTYQLSVYFQECSVDLFQTQTIYVFEKDGGQFIPADLSGMKFGMKYDRYQFFTVDDPYKTEPKVTIFNTLIPKNNMLNVMCCPKSQGVWYDKMITLESVSGFDIEIIFYCEGVQEDDRLVTLLANSGEYLGQDEEYIFRESNINEELTDKKLLNFKRKELLAELHNIKPYLSSYKGILNILQFFNYPELELKEYFLDVLTDKICIKPIGEYVPNNLLKLSQFALFYPLNRVINGKYTERGLPETENVFLFTLSEIIIKLFGLKKYIQSREIGGNCHIVDIIGEYIHFNKYDMIYWIDDVFRRDFVLDSQPEIQIIQHTQHLENKFEYFVSFSGSCSLERDPDTGIPFADPLCNWGWFEPRKGESFTERGIETMFSSYIPGCEISLTCHNLKIPIKSIQDRIISFEPMEIPIIHFGYFRKYSHVQWVIYKNFNGGKIVEKIIEGKPQDMKSVNFVIHHDGVYDVQVKLHKYGGEILQRTIFNALNIKQKQLVVDFYSKKLSNSITKSEYKDFHTYLGWWKYLNQYGDQFMTTNSLKIISIDRLISKFDGISFKSLSTLKQILPKCTLPLDGNTYQVQDREIVFDQIPESFTDKYDENLLFWDVTCDDDPVGLTSVHKFRTNKEYLFVGSMDDIPEIDSKYKFSNFKDLIKSRVKIKISQCPLKISNKYFHASPYKAWDVDINNIQHTHYSIVVQPFTNVFMKHNNNNPMYYRNDIPGVDMTFNGSMTWELLQDGEPICILKQSRFFTYWFVDEGYYDIRVTTIDCFGNKTIKTFENAIVCQK